MTEMQVSTAAEKPSRQEQIEGLLTLAREKQEPLRVRLPFTVYDYQGGRSYTALRDTAWNITLGGEVTPEGVESLIQTIGKCLDAIVTLGTDEVNKRLEAGA